MKRIVISFALMVSLLIPTASPVNAAEKCFANFADSEWANGTPSSVKSLLGFDLVEKITKTPDSNLSFVINSFYLFGEHSQIIKYNYLGKNCTNREIIVSKSVNEQSLKYGYQTLSEFISKSATDFLIQENATKYYSNIKEYFSNKTFNVKSRQILPQDEASGSTRGIQRVLINESSKLQVSFGFFSNAFIYFPTKCAYWNTYDENGSETKEKIFAVIVGKGSGGTIKFESRSNCTAELRLGSGLSVAEKIADIKYVVSSTPSTTTITCKKGKTTKKVKGTNPKCPAGYKKA
jgi:hypothetical protein